MLEETELIVQKKKGKYHGLGREDPEVSIHRCRHDAASVGTENQARHGGSGLLEGLHNGPLDREIR